MTLIKKIRRKGIIKTTCSKCDQELDESRKGKYRYCKKCHAAHMRDTRPKDSELSVLAYQKARCRHYTHTLVKRGDIKKLPCCVCGEESEAHHEDYTKPKEVVWYCREHHLEYHSKQKTQSLITI